VHKYHPKYKIATEILESWRDDILSGKEPTIYPVGAGELVRIEIGPGLVTLIGGAPGMGKTAFAMQILIDALRLSPTIRALVCNVEMPPSVLLDRQLARLSGVDLTTIRYRKLQAKHADRIDQALNTLEPLAERLCFTSSPFDLANVAAAADDFHADILLLDYIQRIPPPGAQENRRGSVDATMSYLREFAETGLAVVVVSAVSRSKDKKGRSSYDGEGLNLASFRESSELEFGADDAFILTMNKKHDEGVILRHLKSRYGQTENLHFTFDRRRQSFISESEENKGHSQTEKDKQLSTLAVLWDKTSPAPESSAGEA